MTSLSVDVKIVQKKLKDIEKKLEQSQNCVASTVMSPAFEEDKVRVRSELSILLPMKTTVDVVDFEFKLDDDHYKQLFVSKIIVFYVLCSLLFNLAVCVTFKFSTFL
jgi:hypothetical protein